MRLLQRSILKPGRRVGRVAALLVLASSGRALAAGDAPAVPAAPTDPAAMSGAALLRDPAALGAWLRDRNPDLLAAAARVDQAAAGLGQSRVHPNPTLGASAGDYPAGETNPPGLSFSDTAVYSTSIAETIELGKRGPRIDAARLRLEAERQAYRDAVAAKTAEARGLLARVVYLDAKRAALQESLGAARQNAALQATRADKGDLSGNDLDRLLVDTVTLESEFDTAGRDLDEAAADCAAVLQAPCLPCDATLADLAVAAALPAVDDPAPYLERRPDLKSLLLDRDSARQEALLARRHRIPDPSFGVAYTHDNLTVSGDQPKTLLFSIGIPLPVFDRGQHEAARAEGRAVELDRTAAAARTRGREEAGSLLRRKADLESILKRLQDEAVPRSRGVLDTTTAAVNQGSLGMTDLLLARRTHTDLVLRVMDLQYDLFSVRNDLRRALGLDAEAIPEVLP